MFAIISAAFLALDGMSNWQACFIVFIIKGFVTDQGVLTILLSIIGMDEAVLLF